MKTQLRIASLSLLAALCLTLASVPAFAQWNFNNGPCNCDTDALTINNNFVVSDSFLAGGSTNSFMFNAWEYPGDNLGISTSFLGWSISATENGSPVAGGSGIAQGGVNMTDTFLSINAYGYNMDKITVTGFNASTVANNTYWLNLYNAQVQSLNPVYWDEDSGVGCAGLNGTLQGCPNSASDNGLGTIPSESFTISGSSTPEPSSLALFGSGVLGLGGLLRRRFLG